MKIVDMPAQPQFPQTRMRRVRQQDWIRRLVAEHELSASDLIWPLFVCPGHGVRQPINSMPGVERLSVDLIVEAAQQAVELGIPAIALFPATPPEKKSELAEEALNPDNLVNSAMRAIKASAPGVGIICDVALDPYTSHGHDGLLKDGVILNDETLDVLCKQAVVQAHHGCDVIAPSDMMDGRIGAIRAALDQAGFSNVLILSYAAKFASAFYGPFRDAVGSKGNLGQGDKKTYQMNPANTDEAIREVLLDLNEGADMIMVKPGMPYLDIIRRVKSELQVPTYAYQVSGEYAMLTAAAEKGSLKLENCLLETLLCFKRAGTNGVLTYFAPLAAKLINQG